MLALTVKQPWAWAMCYAGKDVENRTWHFPHAAHGQRIAIHAGKTEDECAETYLNGRGIRLDGRAGVRSAIVATAVLAGYATKLTPDGWYEGNGLYGWLLEDRRVLVRPVPCRGAQGLWTVPADVYAALREAIAEPARPRKAPDPRVGSEPGTASSGHLFPGSASS